MHGYIFNLFEEYLRDHHPLGAEKVLAVGPRSGVLRNYPDSLFGRMMVTLLPLTPLTRDGVLEAFGYHCMQRLMSDHERYFDPSWGPLDVLANIENDHIHDSFRLDGASPPKLRAHRVSDQYLIIDYHSQRRMAAFAIGLIRGIISYFGVTNLKVVCQTALHEERVQIQVLEK